MSIDFKNYKKKYNDLTAPPEPSLAMQQQHKYIHYIYKKKSMKKSTFLVSPTYETYERKKNREATNPLPKQFLRSLALPLNASLAGNLHSVTKALGNRLQGTSGHYVLILIFY